MSSNEAGVVAGQVAVKSGRTLVVVAGHMLRFALGMMRGVEEQLRDNEVAAEARVQERVRVEAHGQALAMVQLVLDGKARMENGQIVMIETK